MVAASTLTGLFLGAGASFEAGMPLVWDLTAELRKSITAEKLRAFNAGWRVQGGGYPDNVLEDFIAVLTDPRMHYESVLGYLETQYRRHGPDQQQYHGLYQWLVDLVWFLLYKRHEQAFYLVAGLRYIDGIVGLANRNKPLWIFSTNHDLLVECLAAEYRLPLSCGFTSSVTLPLRDSRGHKTGDLIADLLPKFDLESGRLQFFQHGEEGINLLKLHGALDVFTCHNGEDVLRLSGTPENAAEVLLTLSNAFEGLRYVHPQSGIAAKVTNEIAYADDRGEMQLLRKSLLAGAFKFDPHRDQTLPKIYLTLFAGYLNYVSHLVVIGYGFGDQHINTALRSWLEFMASRKLTIVSPNAASIPSTLLHLASQITMIEASAVAYLEQLSSAPLTNAERQLRDKREQFRAEGRAANGFA